MTEECPECPKYKKPQPSRINWIQCFKCSTWFHNHCINLSLIDSNKISQFHCSGCTVLYGPSLMKRTSQRTRKKIDYVALDQGDIDRINIEEHPHIQQFKDWQGDTHVECIRGQDLLQKGLKSGFAKPVKVEKSERDGLGLYIPDNFSLNLLLEQLGEDHPIEIMDVLTQNSLKPSWNLGEWIEYFTNSPENRERILNVLSLEISHCDIGQEIKRPSYVDAVDLVDKVWPDSSSIKQEDQSHQEKHTKPKVSKYCLMGIQNSYTDFHLDFAGTSVYYTILQGRKQFIFYPPTSLNLRKYIKWLNNHTLQNEFLGNLGLEHGLKIELNQGEVLIIPSGWIHAVYTPVDSIVIGGNFLTSFNLCTQFEIIRVEDGTGVDKKFKFPDFDKLMWFTIWRYERGELELGDEEVGSLKDWCGKKRDMLGDGKLRKGVRESYPGDVFGEKVDEFVERFLKRVNSNEVDFKQE